MPDIARGETPDPIPARWVRVVRWIATRVDDVGYALGDLAQWLRERAPLPPRPLRLGAFDKRLLSRHRAEETLERFVAGGKT